MPCRGLVPPLSSYSKLTGEDHVLGTADTCPMNPVDGRCSNGRQGICVESGVCECTEGYTSTWKLENATPPPSTLPPHTRSYTATRAHW